MQSVRALFTRRQSIVSAGSAAEISALRARAYLFKFDFIFGLVHFFTSNSGFGALFSPPRVGIFSHNYE